MEVKWERQVEKGRVVNWQTLMIGKKEWRMRIGYKLSNVEIFYDKDKNSLHSGSEVEMRT